MSRPPRDAAPRHRRPAARRDAAANAPSRAPNLPGLEARRFAVALLHAVLVARQSLDEALDRIDRSAAFEALPPRDRAFARLIASTVLRRAGSLRTIVAAFLERPLPPAAKTVELILLAAAAQLLLLETPPHAVINLAVEQCRADRAVSRFTGLANAVLRRVASEGPARLKSLDWPAVDIPPWQWQRWLDHYGPEVTSRLAAASLAEAPLDLTIKRDPELWAATLGGELLATGSVRLQTHARVEDLPGYAEGAWWVQDAASSLPTRLLGDLSGARVADLCAAPGGKTSALAAAGAAVTAVDRSATRLARLATNLDRLALHDRVTTVAADLRTWSPDAPFDAILLDAPCTATGTIRRHPDILHLKRPEDAAEMARLQSEVLARAAHWVKPGGLLLFCTCSLEPEEGPGVVEGFLAAHPEFARAAIAPDEVFGRADWLTAAGDLRTRPDHDPSMLGTGVSPGMDGFFAARLRRAPA